MTLKDATPPSKSSPKAIAMCPFPARNRSLGAGNPIHQAIIKVALRLNFEALNGVLGSAFGVKPEHRNRWAVVLE